MGRRKLQILVLVAVIALLAALLCLALSSRPRLYDGKPLTQWVDEYTAVYLKGDFAKIQEFDRKIRGFDPSVVPPLVNLVEMKHPWREQLYEFLFRRKLKSQWANDLQQKVRIESYRPASAAYFLYKLGPTAEPAIPALIRAAADTNQILCANAINALGAIHQRPDLVIPVLTRALTNNQWTAIFASGAVRYFGTNAAPAVPALRDYATNGPPTYRFQAMDSLCRIAPDATLDVTLPYFIKTLETPGSQEAYSAVRCLSQLGPRAREAVPALLKLATKGDDVGNYAAYALRAIDPETAARIWPTIPRRPSFDLSAFLRKPETRDAFNARVRAMGPKALPYLTNLVEARSPNGNDTTQAQYAAHALGEMGPAARPAIPTLSRAAEDARWFIRVAAEAALIKIKGEPLTPVINQLKDTSDSIAWYETAMLVAEFGTNAEPAIPVLLDAIKTSSDNDVIQGHAAIALGQIRRRPDLCIPALIPLLDSAIVSTRQKAMDALLAFGPDAKPALPKAIEALDDFDPWVRSQAKILVKQLDPAAPAKPGIK